MKNLCRNLINGKWCLNSSEEQNGNLILMTCRYQERFSECAESIMLSKPCRVINKTTRYFVLKRQNWRCNICGKKINFDEKNVNNFPGEHAEIDHIHPFSEWRTYEGENINEIENLQSLCHKCNSRKYNKKVL